MKLHNSLQERQMEYEQKSATNNTSFQYEQTDFHCALTDIVANIAMPSANAEIETEKRVEVMATIRTFDLGPPRFDRQ